jgi:hypothetical protein
MGASHVQDDEMINNSERRKKQPGRRTDVVQRKDTRIIADEVKFCQSSPWVLRNRIEMDGETCTGIGYMSYFNPFALKKVEYFLSVPLM